jgi:hypothetical protein
MMNSLNPNYGRITLNDASVLVISIPWENRNTIFLDLIPFIIVVMH